MSDPSNTEPAAEPVAETPKRRRKPGVMAVCTVETLPWARVLNEDGTFDHRQIDYQEIVRLHPEDAPVLLANKQVVATTGED